MINGGSNKDKTKRKAYRTSLLRRRECLNPKLLTKINCHSLKTYNNCLSTKSGEIVIN